MNIFYIYTLLLAILISCHTQKTFESNRSSYFADLHQDSLKDFTMTFTELKGCTETNLKYYLIFKFLKNDSCGVCKVALNSEKECKLGLRSKCLDALRGFESSVNRLNNASCGGYSSTNILIQVELKVENKVIQNYAYCKKDLDETLILSSLYEN